MMMADILFNARMNLPEESRIPTTHPAIDRPKNHSDEMRIHARVKATFSVPE